MFLFSFSFSFHSISSEEEEQFHTDGKYHFPPITRRDVAIPVRLTTLFGLVVKAEYKVKVRSSDPTMYLINDFLRQNIIYESPTISIGRYVLSRTKLEVVIKSFSVSLLAGKREKIV